MSEVVGTAVVEIKADTTGVNTDIRRGFDRAGRDAGRVFGSSFKRNVATVGAGVLAAGGIVGISRSLISLGRDSIKAAADQSAANALVERSVRNAGAEMTIYGQSIEEALEAESRVTGIADDELAPAFTRLVQVTRDSAEAFKLLTLAEDVSRQRGIGVAQAAQSIAKARGGQISALRRIIPGLQAENAELSKQENVTRALAQVRQQFGSSRLSFAESDAGQLQRFNVAVDELKETLGAELLPVLSRVAKRISDTFADPKNQQTTKTFISTTVDLFKGGFKLIEAGAQGIADDLRFQAALQGAENIGRLATAITDLSDRVKDPELLKRTQELVKFQQLNELEGIRARRNQEFSADAAATPERQDRARSTISGDLTRQIAELRAAQSESTTDDLRIFKLREEAIQKQITNLERGGLRGKNDQARLIRLYKELGRVSEETNSIEQAASDAREDAAKERKRIADEDKARADQKREEDAQRAKDEKVAAAQKIRDDKERSRSLKEARLALRVQKAELSGNEAQQRSALRATVRFFDEQAKSFRKQGAKLRAVEAESNKVATQARIRALKTDRQRPTGSTAGAARTDFFQEAANQFRTFGSNIGRAGDPLSGQQARGQFAGLALDRGRNTSNLQGDQLRESQSQTDLLRQIRDRLRVDTRAAEGNQPPNRRPPNATDIARVNARNNLAGR